MSIATKVLLAVVVALGANAGLVGCTDCEGSAYREGCNAYCTTDSPGLPANRIRCLDERAFTCRGGFARCADSTSVEPSLCTADGPRCADGSEPICDGLMMGDAG